MKKEGRVQERTYRGQPNPGMVGGSPGYHKLAFPTMVYEHGQTFSHDDELEEDGFNLIKMAAKIPMSTCRG